MRTLRRLGLVLALSLTAAACGAKKPPTAPAAQTPAKEAAPTPPAEEAPGGGAAPDDATESRGDGASADPDEGGE